MRTTCRSTASSPGIRTLTTSLVAAVLFVLSPVTARAQHDHHSPYAAREDSGIASLSAGELEQLTNGEGMGLARAAELNRYPGPKHVLEAAEGLALTADQRTKTERIFAEMKEEAIALGNRIVEKERELSRRFAHRHIDEESLGRLTAEIGHLQGELRRTHLEAHLRMRELLTEEQIAKYDELRGYAE